MDQDSGGGVQNIEIKEEVIEDEELPPMVDLPGYILEEVDFKEEPLEEYYEVEIKEEAPEDHDLLIDFLKEEKAEEEDDIPTEPLKKVQRRRKLQKDNDADWDCPVCKKKLPETIRLRDHLKVHLSEEDPKCPLCDLKFSRSSRAYSHLITAHIENSNRESESDLEDNNQDNFQIGDDFLPSDEEEEGRANKKEVRPKLELKECKICSKWVRYMHAHMASCHSTHRLKCPEKGCDGKSFAHPQNLDYHIKVHHSKEKPYTCSECEKSFYVAQDLSRHSLSHKEEKRFYCPVCATGYSRADTLRKHLNTHETLDIEEMELLINVHGELKCVLCETEITTSGGYKALKDHVKMKHVTANGKVDCNLCKKSLSNVLLLLDHLFEMHLKCLLSCQKCEYSEQIPSKLEGHVRNKHISKKEKQSICPDCKKSFKTASELGRHTRKYHSEKREDIKCPDCGKTFARMRNLKRHKEVHAEERPSFACKFCDAKFTRKETLTAHYVVHRQEVKDAGEGDEEEIEIEVE